MLADIVSMALWRENVHSHTDAFIVRIWRETLDDKDDVVTWRGSIDHVGSDRRLYFQDLDGIARFIRESTGIDSGRARRKWRAWAARIGQGTGDK